MSLVYCVEDDENIRELVRYALCSQKFQAEAFPCLLYTSDAADE